MLGNACYFTVKKLLLSKILSRNLKIRTYKTSILPALLYACEAWSLTLGDEDKFRVFENKILRTIFGAKIDEMAGEWRKLHNEELHATYIVRFARHYNKITQAKMGKVGCAYGRGTFRILTDRPNGKRPLRSQENVGKAIWQLGIRVENQWL